MSTVNRMIIVGRLGADPELRYTPQGTAVCKFSVATERLRRRDDASPATTDWHRVVAWSRLGEQCHKSLAKGRQVAVVGAVRYGSFTGRDGRKRWTTEVHADEVSFLGRVAAVPDTIDGHHAEMKPEGRDSLHEERAHDLAS